ncbi:MAG: oligosaccharide flippase family protein [Clostridia bacterium]|nr:oligosaccharide flippase family protein [Clostridia bacterium]
MIIKQTNTLIKSALTLSIAGVICKILGALYRVPLTAVLGAEGLGAYQMAFPTYMVLLTLSSTGIPNALSKIIAEGGDARSVLKKSLIFFGLIGAALSIIMYFSGVSIARAQGNELAADTYRALSPSVFLVSLISCVRGYCQGRKNMTPTAASQITEQIVKLAFGLALSYMFGSTPYEKAALATLAVTISEVVALIIVIVWARRVPAPFERGESVSVKRILSIAFPVTLSAIMLPLSRAADGFMVINLLGRNSSWATAQYGLYSGATESVISLPVAVCYAIAAAAVPEISSDKRDESKRFAPIAYTLAISAIIALLAYFSPKLIVRLLYFSLPEESKITLETLLKISSAQIIGLSLVQTMSAVLIASDKLYLPCISLAVGIVVKIILTLILVPGRYGVYGSALADVICYFTAAIIDAVAVSFFGLRREAKLKRALQT